MGRFAAVLVGVVLHKPALLPILIGGEVVPLTIAAQIVPEANQVGFPLVDSVAPDRVYLRNREIHIEPRVKIARLDSVIVPQPGAARQRRQIALLVALPAHHIHHGQPQDGRRGLAVIAHHAPGNIGRGQVVIIMFSPWVITVRGQVIIPIQAPAVVAGEGINRPFWRGFRVVPIDQLPA